MARRGAAAGGKAGAAAAKALISRGRDARVLLLTGKESFLREGYATAFIEHVKADGGGDDVEVVRFDGQTAELAEVLDECRSFGLLAGYKVVIVDNADALVKSSDAGGGAGGGNRAILERYAASPSDCATLILRSEGWRPGNLDKAIDKVGGRIKCEQVDEATAMGQAVRRARERRGVELARDAAALLVDRVGTDLGRLMTEVDKLSDAAMGSGPDGGGTITRALVAELVGVSREEQVWSVQGALLGGDAGYAMGVVRELVEVSRAPTVLIRYAFVDLARKLASVSAQAAAGARPADAAKEEKLWGDALRRVSGAATAERAGAWRAVFSEALAADVRGKTGRGDEIRALEALSVRFASVLADGRAVR